MSKVTRKTIVILLILNLICASINPAIFGLISHAEEEGEETSSNKVELTENRESIGVSLELDNIDWKKGKNNVKLTIKIKADKLEDIKELNIDLPERVDQLKINEKTGIDFAKIIYEGEKAAGIYIDVEKEKDNFKIIDGYITITIQTTIWIKYFLATDGDYIVKFSMTNTESNSIEGVIKLIPPLKEGFKIDLEISDDKGKTLKIENGNNRIFVVDEDVQSIKVEGSIEIVAEDAIDAVFLRLSNKLCYIDTDKSEIVEEGVAFSNLSYTYFNGKGEQKECSAKDAGADGINLEDCKDKKITISGNIEGDALETIKDKTKGDWDWACSLVIIFPIPQNGGLGVAQAVETYIPIRVIYENEQVEAKISIDNDSDNENDNEYIFDEYVKGRIEIKNNNNENKELNVQKLKIKLPEGVIANEGALKIKDEDAENEDAERNLEFARLEDGSIIINEEFVVAAGETLEISIEFQYKYYAAEEGNISVDIAYEIPELFVFGSLDQNYAKFETSVDSDKIKFNNAYNASDILVKIACHKNESDGNLEESDGNLEESDGNLEVGDELKYEIEIENTNDNSIRVHLKLVGVENLKIYSISNEGDKKVLIAPDLKETSDETTFARFERIDIEAGEIATIVVLAKVDNNPHGQEITVSAEVTGNQIKEIIKSATTNTVTRKE